MLYDTKIEGKKVIVHIEPGATHAFLSSKTASSLCLNIPTSTTNVELGDGSTVKSTGTSRTKIDINVYLCDITIFIINMPDSLESLPYIVIGR